MDLGERRGIVVLKRAGSNRHRRSRGRRKRCCSNAYKTPYTQERYVLLSLIVNPLPHKVSYAAISDHTRTMENEPINNQIMPINQTHPRRTQQDNHIPHLIRMSSSTLPRLILRPGLRLQRSDAVLGCNGFADFGG